MVELIKLVGKDRENYKKKKKDKAPKYSNITVEERNKLKQLEKSPFFSPE